MLAIKPGKSALFQAPKDRVSVLMQQISTDMQRYGIGKLMTQRHLIAIDPATREVMDIVCVTRSRIGVRA